MHGVQSSQAPFSRFGCLCELSWHLAGLRLEHMEQQNGSAPPHVSKGRVNLHWEPVLISTHGSMGLVWQTTEIPSHEGGRC